MKKDEKMLGLSKSDFKQLRVSPDETKFDMYKT